MAGAVGLGVCAGLYLLAREYADAAVRAFTGVNPR